jgi:hypothetical protein
MSNSFAFMSMLMFLFVLPSLASTAAASVPEVSYVVSNGPHQRQLVFVNNPEEIHAQAGACDVADAMSFSSTPCARSLFRYENVKGYIRNWWEHTNKTGRSLKYGVRLYNPGPNLAHIAVSGEGTISDSISFGGDEFVQLFKGRNARTLDIPPGRIAWLTTLSNIPPGKFFVGVVDFQVSGQPIIMDNLAFFDTPASVTSPMPFVDRVMGRVREGLVYKGIASASEAHAKNMNFAFSDADAPGRMKVQYRRFTHSQSSDVALCSSETTPLCRGEVGSRASAPEQRDHWVTHIAPDPADSNPKRLRAVVSDMVSFLVPGLPDGCDPSDAGSQQSCFEVSHRYRFSIESGNTPLFPNLGNWAVHYKVSGVLRNGGTKERLVHFGIRADGNSPIAYKASNSGWRQKALTKASASPNDYFPYGEFVVPAGASLPYSVEMVLSGPGAGTLENLVRLVN